MVEEAGMTDTEFVAILRLSDDVSKLYAADRIEALVAALHLAREALKANEDMAGTWALYQHSPEMKAINAALAKREP